MFDFNPVPKPNHKRAKPKRGNHTKVTPKVRREVTRRSGGRCERCGVYGNVTKAHLVSAAQYGAGGIPWNIADLCGTHGTQGCHDYADNTREGREWKQAKREQLIEYYQGEGKKYWEG
jgi:hypothetical protein